MDIIFVLEMAKTSAVVMVCVRPRKNQDYFILVKQMGEYYVL